MLETFREFANKKVVKWLFAIFLIIPFGLFGIDFYFRNGGGVDTVATVGHTRVSTNDFDQALRQQTEQLRQQFRGQFDTSLMDTPEMRRSVLDRLVNERVVAVGADKAGLRLSGRALAEHIAADPNFQVDGKFSKERYDAIARANNLTPAGLDGKLAEQFAQQQYVSSIVESAFVPRASVDSFMKLSEQSREVAVVNLAPEAYLAQVKIGPDEVKAYYDGHPAEYTSPERVRVEFVELSLDALAARATVSPDDVKKVYDEEVKAGKHGTREERRARVQRQRCVCSRLEKIVETRRGGERMMMQCGDAAVIVGADAQPLPGRAAMANRAVHLAARIHQLDRTVQHARRDDCKNLRAVCESFRAESATDERRTDQDILRRNTEIGGIDCATHDDRLIGNIQDHLVPVPTCDNSMWLHGIVILRRRFVRTLCNFGCCRKTGVDVAKRGSGRPAHAN